MLVPSVSSPAGATPSMSAVSVTGNTSTRSENPGGQRHVEGQLVQTATQDKVPRESLWTYGALEHIHGNEGDSFAEKHNAKEL